MLGLAAVLATGLAGLAGLEGVEYVYQRLVLWAVGVTLLALVLLLLLALAVALLFRLAEGGECRCCRGWVVFSALGMLCAGWGPRLPPLPSHRPTLSRRLRGVIL